MAVLSFRRLRCLEMKEKSELAMKTCLTTYKSLLLRDNVLPQTPLMVAWCIFVLLLVSHIYMEPNYSTLILKTSMPVTIRPYLVVTISGPIFISRPKTAPYVFICMF